MLSAMPNISSASKPCTHGEPARRPATVPVSPAKSPSGTKSAASPSTKAVERSIARPRVSRRAPNTETVIAIIG